MAFSRSADNTFFIQSMTFSSLSIRIFWSLPFSPSATSAVFEFRGPGRLELAASPSFTALSGAPSFALSTIPFVLSTLSILVLTEGSRFLRVTGRAAPPLSSIIPKRAENFASGGYESVLIVSGNLSLFDKVLPASSFRSFGTSMTNDDFSGKGPLKEIPFTKFSSSWLYIFCFAFFLSIICI